MSQLIAYCDASFCPKRKAFKFASVFLVDKVKVFEYESPVIKNKVVNRISEAEAFAVIHTLDLIYKNKKHINYFGINGIIVFNDSSRMANYIKNAGLSDILDKVKCLVNGRATILHKSRKDKHIQRCDFLASVNK